MTVLRDGISLLYWTTLSAIVKIRLVTMDEATTAVMAEKVRPLVNDILARFNTEGISPPEAGMVVLAVTHRLLGLMEGHPEERQFFIMGLINVVNSFLAGTMDQPSGNCGSEP